METWRNKNSNNANHARSTFQKWKDEQKTSCTQHNKTRNHEQEIKATVKKLWLFPHRFVCRALSGWMCSIRFYMIFGLLFKKWEENKKSGWQPVALYISIKRAFRSVIDVVPMCNFMFSAIDIDSISTYIFLVSCRSVCLCVCAFRYMIHSACCNLPSTQHMHAKTLTPCSCFISSPKTDVSFHFDLLLAIFAAASHILCDMNEIFSVWLNLNCELWPRILQLRMLRFRLAYTRSHSCVARSLFLSVRVCFVILLSRWSRSPFLLRVSIALVDFGFGKCVAVASSTETCDGNATKT